MKVDVEGNFNTSIKMHREERRDNMDFACRRMDYIYRNFHGKDGARSYRNHAADWKHYYHLLDLFY